MSEDDKELDYKMLIFGFIFLLCALAVFISQSLVAQEGVQYHSHFCWVPYFLSFSSQVLFVLARWKGFLATSMLPMVRNQLTAWIPCWPKTRVQPLHQLIHDNHHISLRSLPASQSSATIEHTSQYQSQSHCQWSCGNVNFHDNLLLQYV